MKRKTRGALAITILAGVSIAVWPGLAFWHLDGANAAGRGRSINGFDLSKATIPLDRIFSGGPPKDGIPAILHPKFVEVTRMRGMRDDDLVIGFSHNGDTRAYSLRILVWHEIVNDTVGGWPIAVTYCPLCGTSMIFDRRAGRQTLSFGVSGLLYQSDVLMYDHQTESLWSQLEMQAVAGKLAGRPLNWLPSQHMTWRAWKERYPNSAVLSTDTGYNRNYGGTAYKGYETNQQTMFPVPHHRTDLPNKTWVVGVIVNGMPKAYPVRELERLGGKTITDTVGGTSIHLQYDARARFVEVAAEDNANIPSVSVYWFAWQAFYPNTELYGGS